MTSLFQAMIACLQKTDNNQAMCSNEIKSFQSCYEKFKLEDAKLQEIKQKGIRPVGPRAKYVWLPNDSIVDSRLTELVEGINEEKY